MIGHSGRKFLTVITAVLAGVALIAPMPQAWADGDGQSGQQYGADPQTRAKIHTELGSLYFQGGNMAVALDELRIALEADSNYAPAYNVRGLVHTYLHEMPEADEDFRKALRLTPSDPDVNNNYGWFLCQNGKEKESIGYFSTAFKNPLYATPDRAFTNAGACALKAGDLEGAERYLQQAIRIARDGAPVARVELARLNYRRGTLEEARRIMSEVLKTMEPATADALWLALRIERKLGNRDAETGLAGQLRSRYPGSPEYQEFLKGNFE